MKKYLKIYMALLMAVVLGSCAKENPFPSDEEGSGKLMKSALMVSLENEEGLPDVYGRPTRAAVPTADDFTVAFYKDGDQEATASYLFSEMPEIVVLPAGAYRAVATFGENAPQAWEAPHYKGETQFIIVADRITDDIEPIVARLSNVRVSIAFSPNLVAAMGSDAKVTVKVGESGTLDFTHADVERSGYFAYVENSRSLTATFTGTVDGTATTESKVYDNVAPGNHYRITFRLHDAADDGDGAASGSITVDASVEVVDMNISLDADDDVLEDDMRPAEEDEENPDQPTPGPGDDVKLPAVSAISATGDNAGMNSLNFDIRNNTTDLYCAFKVVSYADGGIEQLDVDIVSAALTKEELQSVGLDSHLDLVNPGSLATPLKNLGFPINVGGMKEVSFNITNFMPMLEALGEGDHDFVITVKDANGTTVKTLKLHSN